MSTEQKTFYKKTYYPRLKVKHRVLFSKHLGKEVCDYLHLKPSQKINYKQLGRLFINFKHKPNTYIFKSDVLKSLFDIHFLRKEKMYTKLKYSRVPQYDIVSGGLAALLSGFIGFLITEKYGFELLDSGDFYFLFIYFVFLFFFLGCF